MILRKFQADVLFQEDFYQADHYLGIILQLSSTSSSSKGNNGQAILAFQAENLGFHFEIRLSTIFHFK